MKYFFALLFIPVFISGCYKSAYEGAPPTTATLGTGIFQEATSSKISDDYKAPEQRIANTSVRLYMLEQQALFRARLDQHAIKAEMDDKYEITLDIPGNISFSINSATLNWNMHAVLDKISAILRTYVDTSITVIGHTDARGDPEINNMLSKQRAETVANYLIRTGVSFDRIIYFGVADRNPITGNQTTQQRSLNRRFQIIITPMLPVTEPAAAAQQQQKLPAQKQDIPPINIEQQETEIEIERDKGEAVTSPYPINDYDL